ncbi:MAG: HupE/UreJ family protein [Planctomycetes bacterium]|nr:HupE/UreJ family protein [Planctomycetota bacterium]MCB9889450.1 HupE/UreJ family protein [Planctomycetota bacterium]
MPRPVFLRSSLLHGLVAGVALFASVLPAHDPGLSSSCIEVREASIRVRIAFHNADLTPLVPGADTDHDGTLDAAELQRCAVALRTLFGARSRLVCDGVCAAPVSVRVGLDPDAGIECLLEWPRGACRELTWNLDLLRDMPRGHRNYAVVLQVGRGKLVEALLTAGSESVRAGLAAAAIPRSNQALFTEFLGLGVEHILIGYDHILFLLGLLLVCRTVRGVGITITAFTLAHSLTLGASALQLVHLPGQLVEATIAASIVWVGVHGLLRKDANSLGSPWLTSFLFGLVHGFGFASVLAELGIARSGSVVAPLLAFNTGVELGQLAIAAVLVPLLMWSRRRAACGRWVTPLVSILIAVAGGFWLIERTLFAA